MRQTLNTLGVLSLLRVRCLSLALRYHGHQFQTYNPDIGDGRGFFLPKHCSAPLFDFRTKGTGTTPYSRSGDGQLAPKGGARGIATPARGPGRPDLSHLCDCGGFGYAIYRGDEPSPTRAALLTRLQHSHIDLVVFKGKRMSAP